MTITLTREEAQQVLDAVNTAYGAACFEAAKILRSKLSEPNIVQDAIVFGTGITKDGKRIDPAGIYKEPEPETVMAEFKFQEYGWWRDEDGKLQCGTMPRREWQGLTDEDRQELAAEQYGWEGLCSAVEAKLREKNNV